METLEYDKPPVAALQANSRPAHQDDGTSALLDACLAACACGVGRA